MKTTQPGGSPVGNKVQETATAQAHEPVDAPVLMRALARGWQWLAEKRKTQLGSRRLRVVETVSLGEKRFVAMLHADGARFLIGGGANSVSLLATLDATPDKGQFAELLHEQAASTERVH